MKKQTNLILAFAGAAIMAASPAHAANGPKVSYTAGDLLLDFRDITTPGNDLTMDLGNINTFADAYVGTTVEVTSPTALNNTYSAFGGGNDGDLIGVSAAAETGSDLLFMSRATTTANDSSAPSPQQGLTSTQATAGVIDGIGTGASGGAASGVNTTGFQSTDLGISKISASSSFSYDSQADQGGGNTSITFGGNQSLGTGKIEFTATDGGMANNSLTAAGSFASLWEVPQSGMGSDTYLGYFTFQSDGELEYTGVNPTTATPEPSTYAMLVGAGVLAYAFRRQLKTLCA